MPVTWKNIEAPSLKASGAGDAVEGAKVGIEGFQSVIDNLRKREELQRERNTSDEIARLMMNSPDLEGTQAARDMLFAGMMGKNVDTATLYDAYHGRIKNFDDLMNSESDRDLNAANALLARRRAAEVGAAGRRQADLLKKLEEQQAQASGFDQWFHEMGKQRVEDAIALKELEADGPVTFKGREDFRRDARRMLTEHIPDFVFQYANEHGIDPHVIMRNSMYGNIGTQTQGISHADSPWNMSDNLGGSSSKKSKGSDADSGGSQNNQRTVINPDGSTTPVNRKPTDPTAKSWANDMRAIAAADPMKGTIYNSSTFGRESLFDPDTDASVKDLERLGRIAEGMAHSFGIEIPPITFYERLKSRVEQQLNRPTSRGNRRQSGHIVYKEAERMLREEVEAHFDAMEQASRLGTGPKLSDAEIKRKREEMSAILNAIKHGL